MGTVVTGLTVLVLISLALSMLDKPRAGRR